MHIRVAPQAFIRSAGRPKPIETDGKIDGIKKEKRQIGGTNPMELLNKSIEIVERNQWNR